MQLAILIVLIIIAVILAPWLLGVALALVALYGVWVVVAGIAAMVGLLVLAIVLYAGHFIALKRGLSRLPSKTEQMIAESNKKFRADADEKDRASAAEAINLERAAESRKQRSYRQCPWCQEQMSKFGLFCPHCGKDPKSKPN